MREPTAGTGWKMNRTAAHAERLKAALAPSGAEGPDISVPPPFAALHAARRHFADDLSGAWTGEISAPMPVEAGCRHVGLADGTLLAGETRVIHRRPVAPEGGGKLVRLPDVDGPSVGRADWSPDGFAHIVDIVHRAAQEGSLP